MPVVSIPLRAVRPYAVAIACVAVVACSKVTEDRGDTGAAKAVSAPTGSGAARTPLAASASAAPPASSPNITVEGVVMPAGSTLYSEARGAGHEGAPFAKLWVATPLDTVAVAAWLDDPARKLTRNKAWDDAWDVSDRSYVRIYGDPQTGRAPRGYPDGTKTWVFVYWGGAPAPCPPCPKGFSGTLQPGCNCP